MADDVLSHDNEHPGEEEEDADDDDDEMADLFSFGSSDDPSSHGPRNGTHPALPTAATTRSFDDDDEGRDTHAVATSVDPPFHTSSDASSMMVVPPSPLGGGADSPDSFLELLTAETSDCLHPHRPITTTMHGLSAFADSHDPETRDILDWLDADNDGEELVVFASQLEPPPVPIPIATVVSLPPAFVTLNEALASSESTVHQVRMLYSQELQEEQRLRIASTTGTMDRPPIAAKHINQILTETQRAELYCRMICHKSIADTARGSLADSFDQWKASTDLRKLSNKEDHIVYDDDDDEEAYIAWLQNEEQHLFHRISQQTEQGIDECRLALIDLLVYHRHQNKDVSVLAGTVPPDSLSAVEPSRPNDADRNQHDVLLPMVATAILSAGPMPVSVAAVMLSQIVPTFMPLLALPSGTALHDERWESSLSLHAEFYLLACYHVPLLVFHLDRYMPGWHWPRNLTSSLDFVFEQPDPVASSPVSLGRNLQKQGQMPLSWFLSFMAGECGGTRLPTSTLLLVWDGLLTGQNNAARFFLALAVLEQYAPSLLLLVGDDLAKALGKVWTLQDIDKHKEDPDDRDWVFEWLPHALCLQQSTPDSVLARLQRIEDDAIQQVLRRRHERAEAALRARLEAEASAHREAQEAKADEARQRLSRARLVAFYRKHAPDKESNIDKILETYSGRLELLDSKLKGIYGEGFNPAVKLKPPPPPPVKVTNKLLATMNQGLSRNKPTNEFDVDETVDVEERKPDFVSVTVTPDEVLPVICWSKEATAARCTVFNHKRHYGKRSSKPPLKYYLVDSRSEESCEEQGRFPTAVSLSPEALMDPERIQQNVDMFESLRGAVHIVIMGEGFSAIPSLYNQRLSPKLEELMEQDESRTNLCALFFQKRGFCFVSLLEGGFCAAHAWLVRDGPKQRLSVSAVLVDYSPDANLFGQLETLHNASAAEKAQRKMANLIEASLVTVTKRAYQFEKMTSEIDSKDGRQGIRMSLFGRSENFAAEVEDDKVMASDNASKPTAFKNPFFILGKRDETSTISETPILSPMTMQATTDTSKELGEPSFSPVDGKLPTVAAPNPPQKSLQAVGQAPIINVKEETTVAGNPFKGIGAAFSQTRARFGANNSNAVASSQAETTPVGLGGRTLGVGGSSFGFNQLRKSAMSRVSRNTGPNATTNESSGTTGSIATSDSKPSREQKDGV